MKCSVAVIVLLAGSCVPAEAQPASIPVQFVQVTLLDESDLAAPDAGRCFELPVGEGQRVERGDLLIRLDDTQEKIGVDRAATELQIAQMKAGNSIAIDIAVKADGAAKAKLKRSEEARIKYPKSIPEEVIEELQFLSDKTESEIAQARFDLELAKKDAARAASELELAREKLDRRQVRSPFGGVVVEVFANEGEWVEAGQKLARVVRLDRLRVTGFVPSKYLPDELIGREAEFTAIREGRDNVTLKLKIEYVSPEANPVSGERRVWVEIDNRDGRLFPGMPAKLEILPESPK